MPYSFTSPYLRYSLPCTSLLSTCHCLPAILNPEDSKDRTFTFDFSYNSFVPRDDRQYASQLTVWNDIGVGILNNAWEGMCSSPDRATRALPPSLTSPALSPVVHAYCTACTAGSYTGYNTSLFAYGQTGAGKVCVLMRL